MCESLRGPRPLLRVRLTRLVDQRAAFILDIEHISVEERGHPVKDCLVNRIGVRTIKRKRAREASKHRDSERPDVDFFRVWLHAQDLWCRILERP
jgi:hypothetical protein